MTAKGIEMRYADDIKPSIPALLAVCFLGVWSLYKAASCTLVPPNPNPYYDSISGCGEHLFTVVCALVFAMLSLRQLWIYKLGRRVITLSPTSITFPKAPLSKHQVVVEFVDIKETWLVWRIWGKRIVVKTDKETHRLTPGKFSVRSDFDIFLAAIEQHIKVQYSRRNFC
jgi:hypothetical protein